MKKVVTYIAYDDKEFDDFAKCEAYESDAFKKAYDLYLLYDFYDAEGNDIDIATYNLEALLSDLDYAFQSCVSVRVFDTVPKESYEFMYNYYGWD